MLSTCDGTRNHPDNTETGNSSAPSAVDAAALRCVLIYMQNRHTLRLLKSALGINGATVRETPFRSLRYSKRKIVTAIAKDSILSC